MMITHQDEALARFTNLLSRQGGLPDTGDVAEKNSANIASAPALRIGGLSFCLKELPLLTLSATVWGGLRTTLSGCFSRSRKRQRSRSLRSVLRLSAKRSSGSSCHQHGRLSPVSSAAIHPVLLRGDTETTGSSTRGEG